MNQTDMFHVFMNNMHDLAAVDMNLFVAFDHLAREGNVTRAAARAGVTQSAMSHTLRRLRELFDDPLFVRGPGGVSMTPRAEALVVPLRTGLSCLQRALEASQPFEPSQTARTFRLAAPDLFDLVVLPALSRRLADVAPDLDLVMSASFAQLSPRLETGDLDLAVVPIVVGDADAFGPGPAPNLRQRTLFSDAFRCFARADHPAVPKSRRMSLTRYCAGRHVLVSPTGEGPALVDTHLEAQGVDRRVALRVASFSSAVAVVQDSDLLLTAPAALASASIGAGLMSMRVPFELPEHRVTMIWHERFSSEPGHRWLRETVATVTSAMRKSRRAGGG